MSSVIRSHGSNAEVNLRDFAEENLRVAIRLYLHVIGELQPHPEDELRRYAVGVIEQSLGLTGRELGG